MQAFKETLLCTRVLKDICTPLKPSARVQYVCVCASNENICIGATTGTVYVFDRSTGKLNRFVANKVSPVTHVQFSPNKKYLAVVQGSGTITCWEFEQDSEIKMIRDVEDFCGENIQAVCWNTASTKLFVGCESGLVAAYTINNVSLSMSRMEVILKKGDPVVQLDSHSELLVISSTTKAMLCFTDRSQFHQIGKKPRDGKYGSVFLKKDDDVVVYSARPGSRLWQVNCHGEVMATHQFKELLNIQPAPILTSRDMNLPPCNLEEVTAQSFNFPYLYTVLDKYLLTWTEKGIYLFEPNVGGILLWNDQIKDVADIAVFGSTIYCLHRNGVLTELNLLSTKRTLHTLQDLHQYTTVAQLAYEHSVEILSNVESFLSIGFHDLLDKLQENEKTSEFLEFLASFEQKHMEVRAAVQSRLNESHESNTTNTPPSECEDTRSIVSGGSGASSRMSLSRLFNLSEQIADKASSAVQKVTNSGFIKKSLAEILQSDHPQQQHAVNLHDAFKKTLSMPSSPQASHRVTKSSKSDDDIHAASQQEKRHSMPEYFIGGDEQIIFASTTVRSKRKKKKKQKIIDLENGEGKLKKITKINLKETSNAEKTTDTTPETSTHQVDGQNGDGFAPPGVAEKFVLQLPVDCLKITNKLFSITTHTRNDFRDTKILYNANLVREALVTWSSQLSSVAEQIEREAFNTLHPTICKQMSKEVFSFVVCESKCQLVRQLLASGYYGEVSNMAMMCVETDTYPPACHVLHAHEIQLLNFRQCFARICTSGQQSIMEILKNNENEPVGTGTSRTSSLSTIYSDDDTSSVLDERPYLCETDAKGCQSCLLDRHRACFILRYFPMLDWERVRSLLLWKGGCRWRSWAACIIHLQDNEDCSLRDLLDTGDINSEIVLQSDIKDFLSVFKQLSVHSPELLVRYLHENNISTWECSLLFHTGYVEGFQSSFLDYVTSLRVTTPHDPLFVYCACMDALSLQTPEVGDLFCKCGHPRSLSNRYHWQYGELLHAMVDATVNNIASNVWLKRLKQLFKTYGYWKGLVEILLLAKDIEELLQLLLHLGDKELLFDIIAREGVQLTVDPWKKLLSQCQEKHTCQTCSETTSESLSTEDIVLLAAKHIGVAEVVRIVQSSTPLPLRLYSKLLQILQLQNRQGEIVEKILEVASNNVWSEGQSPLIRQLNRVKELELVGKCIEVVDIPSENIIIDETDTNWGHSFNLTESTCAVCTLPLCIKASTTISAGLMLFPCGHIYHKVCVPEVACLICYQKNFTSIY